MNNAKVDTEPPWDLRLTYNQKSKIAKMAVTQHLVGKILMLLTKML